MQLISTIHCPECGFEQAAAMPIDACQIMYHCSSCGSLLRPKTGDCCVFCSYGTHPCPPKQQEQVQFSSGASSSSSGSN